MEPTLVLPATLTLAQAREVLDGLALPPSSQGPWVVDAGALAEFDTGALSVLLELQRRASAQGAALQVHQAPPKLRQLASLYGVDGLLGLQPSA